MTETDASDAEAATELGVDAVVTQASAPPAGILTGYARCSTETQDLSAQREILRGLGVADERVYLDHGVTGTNRSRQGNTRSLSWPNCFSISRATVYREIARTPATKPVADVR